MTNEEVAPEMTSGQEDVGTRLKVAREAAGKTLADISASTRVPTRLLDALERNAVEELPRGPYAIGFARTYARAVGLDETEVADSIRALQQQSASGVVAAMDAYEPADSSRVPPSALAWVAGGIALLLVIAYFVWRSMTVSPDAEPAAAPEETAATSSGQPAATAPATAVPAAFADSEEVRIAASGPVWFSLENAEGRGVFSLTLSPGEFYTIKPEQRSLFLRTGRPQVLRIMVGGRTLPQLGRDDEIVSKVALDGASLARLAASPPPVGGDSPVTTPLTGTTTVAPSRLPQQ